MCIYAHASSDYVRGGMRGSGKRGEGVQKRRVLRICRLSRELLSTKVFSGLRGVGPASTNKRRGRRNTRQPRTETHIQRQRLERKIEGGISGWRRGAKENTSQNKQKRFPRRAAQSSVGGQQRAGVCSRPWIHSFIHLLSQF